MQAARLISDLAAPTILGFAENATSIDSLRLQTKQLAVSEDPMGQVWHLSGGSPTAGLRILITPSGHAVVYGAHGRRILYLDPSGNPLHECAWGNNAVMLRARVQLDSGLWVGILPEGLVNVARFDISNKPGWQRLTRDDLYRMASQAMGVPPEEVRFFYDEPNLTLDAHGSVTVRHRKDALYLLEEGDFERRRFMACMGAMHWGQIDFLPVVELFQSLVAGTGSAVFELIRGLYDDQSSEGSPRLLRYRGIPTYPSPQAFQLFSTYFAPQTAGGDPLALFMDPRRSAEVQWRPRTEAPRRFIDVAQGLAVTVIAGSAQKVTKRADPAAVPFSRPRSSSPTPAGRMLGVKDAKLLLQDEDRIEAFNLDPVWGIRQESPLSSISPARPGWRGLFSEGFPQLDARQAYLAVPLYPEDDAVVEELATQSLAMEQILSYLERWTAAGSGTETEMLIDLWDGVIAELIEAAAPSRCLVLYQDPAFAQRQAQRLWDHAAAAGHLERLTHVRFLPGERRAWAYGAGYHLACRWIRFKQYHRGPASEHALEAISKTLVPGGAAVVVGPPWFGELASRLGLQCKDSSPLAGTAGVSMLQAILPKAQINPEAIVFLLQKS
jgi:hypothetical protein